MSPPPLLLPSTKAVHAKFPSWLQQRQRRERQTGRAPRRPRRVSHRLGVGFGKVVVSWKPVAELSQRRPGRSRLGVWPGARWRPGWARGARGGPGTRRSRCSLPPFEAGRWPPPRPPVPRPLSSLPRLLPQPLLLLLLPPPTHPLPRPYLAANPPPTLLRSPS